MNKRRRRNHSPGFKAEVAMAAIRGDKTMVEIAQEYDVHPNQIQEWRKRLVNEAEHLFETSKKHTERSTEQQVRELHAKIGELTMERDLLSKTLSRNR